MHFCFRLDHCLPFPHSLPHHDACGVQSPIWRCRLDPKAATDAQLEGLSDGPRVVYDTSATEVPRPASVVGDILVFLLRLLVDGDIDNNAGTHRTTADCQPHGD